MYRRALNEWKKAWGPDHTFILRTINNLRLLNASQDEHMKMKDIYSRALDRSDEAHDINQHSQLPSLTWKAILNRLKAGMRRRKSGTAEL